MKRFYAVLSFIIAIIFIASTACATTSYKVRKGDTLQKISRKYKVSVAEIKESNGLKCSKLSIGMKLSLPVAETGSKNNYTSHNSKNDPSNHSVSDRSVTENDENVHVVKRGDTLKSLARKYGVTVNELKKNNNLKRSKLKAGQQIVIKSNSHAPNTYTAQKGDTIRRVAKRFKLNVDDLKEINGLQENSLKPGQKLYLAVITPKMKEDASKPADIFAEKSGPAVTSARLEEVKEMSTSEDVLADLDIKERMILFAKKMLHLPYHFGGNGAIGLDCSGYVQRVFSFIGQQIPHSAREQFNLGEAVDKKDLESGDLVFFRTYASFPSHVGIYLGNNLFIHASSLSRKITIDSLETPYYVRRFIGAKRVLQDEDGDIGSSETPTLIK